MQEFQNQPNPNQSQGQGFWDGRNMIRLENVLIGNSVVGARTDRATVDAGERQQQMTGYVY
jgi:hypothetical protein